MKRKAKAIVVAMALAGMPLVTTATCDPGSTTIRIFRNDDDHDHWHGDFFLDEILFDGHDHYHDDYYYYDDYDDGIIYDGECILCF